MTAGNAPGITDGAAATIVASERAVERLGLKPLARIVGYAQAEVEPKWLFLAPIQGVRRLLDRIELPIEAFDLVEINEAFAAQTLADGRELGFDFDRVNVNGGAIALGHPIGASGARIVATLLHELTAARGPLRSRDAVPRRRRVRGRGVRAGLALPSVGRARQLDELREARPRRDDQDGLAGIEDFVGWRQPSGPFRPDRRSRGGGDARARPSSPQRRPRPGIPPGSTAARTGPRADRRRARWRRRRIRSSPRRTPVPQGGSRSA